MLKILKAVVIVAVGLLLLGSVATCLILIGVSLPNPNARAIVGVESSTETYLRNQTGAPLFITLTLPRSSLRLDTVWWGINSAPEAVGRAVVARHVFLACAGSTIPGPMLLEGSGDTLVADRPLDLAATGLMGKRKRYYPHQNVPLWTERLRQYQPAFSPSIRLRQLPHQPDSLRLTVAVAPQEAFMLAKTTRWLGQAPALARADSRPPCALAARVRWTDSLGRVQTHRVIFPDSSHLYTSEKDSTLGNYTQRRYLDYR